MSLPISAQTETIFFQVYFGIHALRAEWTRNGERWKLRCYVFHSSGDVVEVKAVEGATWIDDFTCTEGIGNTSWDLQFTPKSAWQYFIPKQLDELSLYDVQVREIPEVVVNGRIEVAGKTYYIEKSNGRIGHYYGNRLPRNSWWLGSTEMEELGYSVSGFVFRSGLWGSKPMLRIGFVRLTTPTWTRHITAPLARLVVKGGQPDLQLIFKPIFDEKIELRFSSDYFLHPEPGIRLSLLGDLYVYVNEELVCHSLGKAAAERRLIQ